MIGSSRIMLFAVAVAAGCLAVQARFDARSYATTTAPGALESTAQARPKAPEYFPPPYTLGAPLNNPTSFDVDEYGRIYVVDPGRFAVLVFGADGALETVWREGDFGEDVHVVRDFIDVVSSDLVFLGGSGPSNVLRLSPLEPNGVAVLPGGYNSPVLGRADRGYYELCRGPQIRSLNPDGDEMALAPTGFLCDNWCSPMDTDDMGNAYTYDGATCKMYCWNSHGDKIRDVQLPLCEDYRPGDICYEQVAVDGNGDIYAVGGSICRFDSRGKLISQWTPWVDPREHPDRPRFGPGSLRLRVRNGIIYALLGREIQAYTASGRCIARYLIPNPQFNCPMGIAVQPDGSFAVAQGRGVNGGDCSLLLDPTGKEVAKIYVGWVPQFMAIAGGSYYVASGSSFQVVDSSGKQTQMIASQTGEGDSLTTTSIWSALANAGVDRVCQYQGGGVCVNTWRIERIDNISHRKHCGLRAIGADGKLLFSIPDFPPRPDDMAADQQGNIYAVVGYRNEVVKYDPQGKLVLKLDSIGWELGQLFRPEAILVDGDGNILVLDTGNSRIQVFNPAGEPLGVWGRLGTGDGELDHPRAMCFGPNSTLWIADTRNDRIVWIPLARLWNELTREVTPPPPPHMMAKRESLPANGQVALSGVVTADARDGAVYAQHATGSWGVRLQLPKGVNVAWAKSYQITGKLSTKGGENVVTAKSVKPIELAKPRPIGLSNASLARAARGSGVSGGVLVATWGKVISTDKAGRSFTVTDGSMGAGCVKVTCGKRITGSIPARVGQYVALTGVALRTSTRRGLQIRDKSDVRDIGLTKPKLALISMNGVTY